MQGRKGCSGKDSTDEKIFDQDSKLKVDGREDVEAITSSEEYRKKDKDDETEVERVDVAVLQ